VATVLAKATTLGLEVWLKQWSTCLTSIKLLSLDPGTTKKKKKASLGFRLI
jgi:hypothetical protein